jgi:cell division protein FtsB
MLRPLPIILIGLLFILQVQLWFGRGSIPEVMRLSQRLELQNQKNVKQEVINERLRAELTDLQIGLEMVEERARSELGMVKSNEIFVQISK